MTPGPIVAFHRVPRGHPVATVPGEPIVEAPAQGLAALATIALLFAAVVQVMLLARHRRDVEAQLDEAHAQVDALRARLDEANRPPAQFARMRLRESAVYRFARLRRAVPHRVRMREAADATRDLVH